MALMAFATTPTKSAKASGQDPPLQISPAKTECSDAGGGLVDAFDISEVLGDVVFEGPPSSSGDAKSARGTCGQQAEELPEIDAPPGIASAAVRAAQVAKKAAATQGGEAKSTLCKLCCMDEKKGKGACCAKCRRMVDAAKANAAKMDEEAGDVGKTQQTHLEQLENNRTQPASGLKSSIMRRKPILTACTMVEVAGQDQVMISFSIRSISRAIHTSMAMTRSSP